MPGRSDADTVPLERADVLERGAFENDDMDLPNVQVAEQHPQIGKGLRKRLATFIALKSGLADDKPKVGLTGADEADIFFSATTRLSDRSDAGDFVIDDAGERAAHDVPAAAWWRSDDIDHAAATLAAARRQGRCEESEPQQRKETVRQHRAESRATILVRYG